jgi:hypothetical protein
VSHASLRRVGWRFCTDSSVALHTLSGTPIGTTRFLTSDLRPPSSAFRTGDRRTGPRNNTTGPGTTRQVPGTTRQVLRTTRQVPGNHATGPGTTRQVPGTTRQVLGTTRQVRNNRSRNNRQVLGQRDGPEKRHPDNASPRTTRQRLKCIRHRLRPRFRRLLCRTSGNLVGTSYRFPRL